MQVFLFAMHIFVGPEVRQRYSFPKLVFKSCFD
jgi:hypothetical protein